MRAVSVILVDPSAAFRSALRSQLELSGFTVLGEAATLARGWELLHLVHPDLVVIDVSLPAMGELGAADFIRGAHRDFPETALISIGGGASSGEGSSRGLGTLAHFERHFFNFAHFIHIVNRAFPDSRRSLSSRRDYR